jgi:RHO1 GDP-GTP exchange protein 1/2
MNSVPYSSQPVHPVQETDPSLEKYTRAGLTPAQAYQRQVYMAGGHQPATTNPNRRSYHSSHNSISGASAHSQNGAIPDIPKVNLDLTADGDLGLNFHAEGASPLTAVSSSELPWALAETPGTYISIVLGKRDGEPIFLQI